MRRIPQVFSTYVFIIACAMVIAVVSLLPLTIGAEVGTANCADGYEEVNGACKPVQKKKEVNQTTGSDSQTKTTKSNTSDTTHCDVTTFQAAAGGSQSCYEPGVIQEKSGQCSAPSGIPTCASLRDSASSAMGGGTSVGQPTKPEDIIFGPETPVQTSGQTIPNSGQTPIEVVNTKVVNTPSALDRLESMLGLGENGSGDKPTALLPGPASANMSDYTKFTPYDNGAPQFDMASVRTARAGDAFYDGVMSNLFNNLDSLPMQFTPPNVGDVLSGRIFGPPSTFAPVGTAGFTPTPGTGMAPGQNLVSQSVPTSNVPNPLQSAFDRLTNPFSSSPLAGTAGLPGTLLAQMSPSSLANLTPAQQATLQEQLARYQEQQPQNTVFMTTDAAGRPVLAPTPDSLTQPLTSDPFAGESAALARLASGDNLLDPNIPVIPGTTPGDSLKGIVEVSAATPLTSDGVPLVTTEEVRNAFQRGDYGEAIARAGEGMIESTQRLLASVGQYPIVLAGLGAVENTAQSVSDALGFSETGGVDALSGSGQDDIPTGDTVYTDANNNDQGTPGAPSGVLAQATPALSQAEKNALAEYQQAQATANDVANSTDEQVKADAAVAKAQSALEKSGIDPETGQKVVETRPFSPENNPELGGSKERADALKDVNKTTTVTYCGNADCTSFRNVEYRTEAEAKVAEQANKTAESLDRDVKSIQAEQKALADARTWDQKARDLLPDSLRPSPSKDYLICNDADCTNPKQATYSEYKAATDQQIESLKAAETVEKAKVAYIENGLPSSDKIAEKLSGATLDSQPQRTYYDMFGNEYRNAEAAKGADAIALNNESRAVAISGTEKSVSDMEAAKAKYDADVQAQIDAGKIKQADPFAVTVTQNGKEVKMSFEEYKAQAAASVDAMKKDIADSSKAAQDLKQTFAPRPGDGPSVPPISEEAKMRDLAERKLEETAVLKAVEAKTNQDKEFAAIAKLTDAQRRDQAPQIEARLAQAAKDVNAYTTKAQELAGVVPQTQETKDAVAAVERVLTQGTSQLERNIAGLKDWGKDMTGPVGFMVRSIGGSLGNATELVTSYLPNQPAQVVIGKMFDTNPEFTKFITPVKIAGELVNVASTPLLFASPSRVMVEGALASQLEARTATLSSSPLISAPSTAAATADSALARAAATRAEIMDAGIQARFGAPVGATPAVVESRLAPIASVDAAGNGVVRLEPVVTASSRAEGAVIAEGLPGARAGVGEVVGGGIAREITAADIAAKAPVADSAFGRVAQSIKEAGGPDLLGPAWNKAVAPVETAVSGVEAAGASAARRIDNAVADAYKFMNGSYPPGSFRAFEAQFPAAERAGVSAAVDANAALGRTLSTEARSAIGGYESAAAQAAAERARMEAATAAGRTATARAEVQDALAAARARLEQVGLEPAAVEGLAVKAKPQFATTGAEAGATIAELEKGVALDASAAAKAAPIENVTKANAALADTVAAADKGAAARAIKNYESAQADFAKLARENPSSSALDASAARMRSAAQDLAKYDLEPATAGSKTLQKSIVPHSDIATLAQIEKDVSQAISKGDYTRAYDALQKERPALAVGDNSQAYLLSPSGRARIELENKLFNYTNDVAQGIRMENALVGANAVKVDAAAAAKAQPTSFSTNISNAIAACSKGGSCDPRILLTKSLPSPARLLNGAVTASIAFQALAPTIQVARMVETGAARVAVVSTKAASTPYLYGKLAPIVSTDAARVASIKSAVTPAQLAQSYRVLASVPEVKAAVATPSVPAAQAAASQATAVGDYATKVGSALKSAGLEATPLAQTMAQVARDPALALAETAPVRAALSDATAQARAAAIAASAAGVPNSTPVPASPNFQRLNGTVPAIAEVLAQEAFLSDRGSAIFEAQQPTLLGSAADFLNQVVGITPAVAQVRDVCAGNNCGGHKYDGVAMETIRRALGYSPGTMQTRIGSGGERYATYANLGEWLAADIIKRQAYVTQLGKDVLLGSDTKRSQDAVWAVPDRDHSQPVAVLRQQRLNAFAKSGLTTEEATTPFAANDIDKIEKISIATACAEYSKCSPDFIPQAERERARQILARAGIISPQQTVSAPLSVSEKQVAQNAITNAQAAGMRIPTAVAQALTPWAFQERRAVLEGQRIISEVAQNPALTNPAAHTQYTALAQSGGAIQIPGAAGQTIYLPGSEFSSAVPSRQYLVMHHQAGMNALNRANQYHTGAVNVGTRYWIKQNGDIVVARRDGTVEAHIGQVGPSDLDGRKITAASNENSTGIEFEGYGYNTAQQMQSGVALALFLQMRHSISPDRVIPHLKDTDRQEGVAMTQVMRTIAFVPHRAEEQFAKVAQVLQKGIQGIVQAAGQNAATLAAKIQGVQKTLRTVSTPFSDSAVSKTALAQPTFATRSGAQLGAAPTADVGTVRAAPAATGAVAVVPSAQAVTEALAKASAASDAYKQAATGFVRAVEGGNQSLLNSINTLSKASDTAYTEAFEAARTYLAEAGATDAAVAAKARALSEKAVSAKAKLASDIASLKQRNAPLAEYVGASDAHAAALRDIINEAKSIMANAPSSGMTQVRVTTVPVSVVTEKISPPSSLKFRTGSNINPEQARAYLAADASMILGGDPSSEGWDILAKTVKDSGGRLHMYDFGPGGPTDGVMTVAESSEQAAKAREIGLSRDQWLAGTWNEGKPIGWLKSSTDRIAKYQPYSVEFDNLDRLPWLRNDGAATVSFFKEYQKWSDANNVATKIMLKNLDKGQWEALAESIRSGELRGSTFANIAINEGTLASASIAKGIGITEVRTTNSGNYPTPNDLRSDPTANAVYAAYPASRSPLGTRVAGMGKVDGFDLAQATKAGVKLSIDPHVLSTAAEKVPFKIVYTDPASKLTADLTMADYTRLTPAGRANVQMVVTDGNGKAQALSPSAFDEYMSAKFSAGQSGNAVAQLKSDVEKVTGVKAADMKSLTGKNATTVQPSEAGKYLTVATYRSGDSIVRVGTMMPDTAAIVKAFDECKTAGVCAANAKLTFDIKSKNSWRSTAADGKPIVFEMQVKEMQSAVVGQPAAQVPTNTSEKPSARFVQGNHTINPVIGESMKAAAERWGPEYEFRVISGQAGRSSGTKNHPANRAVDITIYNNGVALKNIRSPETFAVYRDFMQDVKHFQDQLFPELKSQGRWGGYFVSGVGQDLMHYDLDPSNIMAAGSWEGGLRPQYASYGVPGDVGKGMGNLATYKPAGTSAGGSSAAAVSAKPTITIQKSVSIKLATPAITDRGIADAGRLLGKEVFTYKVTGSEATHEVKVYASKNPGVVAASQGKGATVAKATVSITDISSLSGLTDYLSRAYARGVVAPSIPALPKDGPVRIAANAEFPSIASVVKEGQEIGGGAPLPRVPLPASLSRPVSGAKVAAPQGGNLAKIIIAALSLGALPVVNPGRVPGPDDTDSSAVPSADILDDEAELERLLNEDKPTMTKQFTPTPVQTPAPVKLHLDPEKGWMVTTEQTVTQTPPPGTIPGGGGNGGGNNGGGQQSPIQKAMSALQDIMKKLTDAAKKAAGAGAGAGAAPATPATPANMSPTIRCTPSAVASAMTKITVSWTCGGGTSSVGAGFNTAGKVSGVTTATIAATSSPKVDLTISCLTNAVVTGTASCPVDVIHPSAAGAANPSTVESGKGSQIVWTSVQTTGCSVYAPPSVMLITGGSSGRVDTPALVRTSVYKVVCGTKAGTAVTVPVTIKVAGDDGAPLEAVVPATAQTTSMTTSGTPVSAAGVAGTAGTVGATTVNGLPVQLCSPGAGMTAFVHCISNGKY